MRRSSAQSPSGSAKKKAGASRPAKAAGKKPAPARKAATPGGAGRGSASQRASVKARRGEPLNADSPAERSPKQENL